jgi:hypothetical protein
MPTETGQTNPPALPPAAEPPPIGRWPWKPVLAVVLAAAALAAYHGLTRPVIGRDGMHLIRMARYMRQSLPVALREVDQHPLYSMLILATHLILGPAFGADRVMGWVASGVLVSAAMRLAIFWPLMKLAGALFDRRTGLWAAWIFVFLPDACDYGTDVLTETTYAFFLMSSAYSAVRLLQHWRLRHGLTAGLCGGLAYMARPEGAIIAFLAGLWALCAAAAAVLSRDRRRRATAGSKAVAFVLLGAGLLVPTLAYMLHMGSVWPKGAKLDSLIHLFVGNRPTASLVGVGGSGGGLSRLPRGFAEFLMAYSGSLRWLYFFLIAGACVDHGGRLRARGGAALIGLAFVAFALGLAGLHADKGYLDRRHTFGIVVLTLPWAGLGVQRLALRIHQAGRRFCPWLAARLRRPALAGRLLLTPQAVSVLLLCCGVAMGAWRLVPFPNYDKAPYRDLAAWLSRQPNDGRPVVDPYGWAAFYANRRWVEWPRKDIRPTRLMARINRAATKHERQQGRFELKNAVIDWDEPLSLDIGKQTDPENLARYVVWDPRFIGRNLDRRHILDLLHNAKNVRASLRETADHSVEAKQLVADLEAGSLERLPRRLGEDVLRAVLFHTTWPKATDAFPPPGSGWPERAPKILELTFPPPPHPAGTAASQP